MGMTRILIVDDEPMLLNVERQILEKKFGFAIETAQSGDEALEKLRSGSYDAIISDFAMPGMNGLELLRRIREWDKDIPYILFTVKERDEIALEALNNGANFYVQKELTPHVAFAELAHKITTAVELVRAQKNLKTQRDLAISCANSKDIQQILNYCLLAAREISNLEAKAN